MKQVLQHWTAQAVQSARQISKDLVDIQKFASDGCTGVPDFIFFDCCVMHDLGYEYGHSRIQEDNKLFFCMKNTLRMTNKNKGWMWFLPYIYWVGVRIFGRRRYKNPLNPPLKKRGGYKDG